MKKLMAIAMASISLYQIPVALAGPINVTDDLSVKYKRTTADGAVGTSGMIYTNKLTGETDLGAGWSGFARLGAQYVTAPGLGDFKTDLGGYAPDQKSVIAIDQFGLIYKTDHLVYKLGRQNVGIGKTALLYSRPDSNIGKKAFADGLTVSGTVGVMDVSGVVVREDNTDNLTHKVYAIRAGYSPHENSNWGLTLGRYQSPVTSSTNHWAMDGTYTFGKNSLTAEFTNSSSNMNNKAYAATWNYGFDDKTAAYITDFKVESSGDMGGQSDFDNNNQGFYYGLTHKLSNADSLEVVYKDQKTISDGKGNTKLEVTFNHSF